MPTFSDSVISADSSYRKALFSNGLALRIISQVQYVETVTDVPVPAHDQVYVGQRPFEGAVVQPILVSDLRQFHLRNAQLYSDGVWNWGELESCWPQVLSALGPLFLQSDWRETCGSEGPATSHSSWTSSACS